MGFEKLVIWVDIKIYDYFFFECRFQLCFESFNELTNPMITLVVFLAVRDKDVVIVPFDNA
jgi:hypothetical protein